MLINFLDSRNSKTLRKKSNKRKKQNRPLNHLPSGDKKRLMSNEVNANFGDENKPSCSYLNNALRKYRIGSSSDDEDISDAERTLDSLIHNKLLAPYYKLNNYPDHSEIQRISLDTGIKMNVVSSWFFHQRKIEYENFNSERNKMVRIKFCEPQLLKAFNENVYFDDKTIKELISKTGLNVNEIKYWRKLTVKRICWFYKRFPNPSTQDIKHESSVYGVREDILKNWSKIKRQREKVSLEIDSDKEIKRLETNNRSMDITNIKNSKRVEKASCPIFPVEVTEISASEEFFKMRKNVNIMSTFGFSWFEGAYCGKSWHEIARKDVAAGKLGHSTRKNHDKSVVVKGAYGKSDLKVLNEIFFNDPFPENDMVVWVCNRLNRSKEQVHNWFQRMRKNYDVSKRKKIKCVYKRK